MNKSRSVMRREMEQRGGPMQQMDCINQQARERELTKRSQAERLAIADSLIASVWEEYCDGKINRTNLQLAVNIQTNVNRIVWKLNELNNQNTLGSSQSTQSTKANTSNALDALKPCPFCRDTHIGLHPTKEGWQIGCNSIECICCHVYAQAYRTRGNAIKAWNRRAGEKDAELD